MVLESSESSRPMLRNFAELLPKRIRRQKEDLGNDSASYRSADTRQQTPQTDETSVEPTRSRQTYEFGNHPLVIDMV